MSISRRKFLNTGIIASLGFLFNPFSVYPERKAKRETKKIIVIGAGIAGLSAAFRLKMAGYEVCVLEARNRAGGRIHSVNFENTVIDTGASWIHGIKKNPLYVDMVKNKLETKITYEEPSHIYTGEGKDISWSDWNKAKRLLSEIEYLSGENSGLSLEDLVVQVLKNNDLNDKEKQIFYGAVRSIYEIPYAEDAENISASVLLNDDYFPGKHVILPDGMSGIINSLTPWLDIKYNIYVTKISLKGSKVIVHYRNTDTVNLYRNCTTCHDHNYLPEIKSKNTFIADKVVVALPVSLLKYDMVKFEPELPEKKKKAIANLGVGTMNKVFLAFEKPFWQQDAYSFQYLKNNRTEMMEFVGFGPYGINNIILAVFSGKHARSIEMKNNKKVMDMVMGDLKGMFGNNIESPKNIFKTKWHTNPLSLGAYPHIEPGHYLSDCDEIAKSFENKIFFAGDATHSKYLGTAHGAYISGIRVADEIIEASF